MFCAAESPCLPLVQLSQPTVAVPLAHLTQAVEHELSLPHALRPLHRRAASLRELGPLRSFCVPRYQGTIVPWRAALSVRATVFVAKGNRTKNDDEHHKESVDLPAHQKACC